MNVAIRDAGGKDSFEREDSGEALKAALFHPMDIEGVYARTGLYEEVVERLASFITRRREPGVAPADDGDVDRDVAGDGRMHRPRLLALLPEVASGRVRVGAHPITPRAVLAV